MTEKLYYNDAYIKEFEAKVLSVEADGERFAVVLDRTAFFPEEGGQSSDKGFIGTAAVLDVCERDGTVYHLCDRAVEQGCTVACSVDFDERFEKMQMHTAEHIMCGIIHKRYGYDNVGFHLGDEEVVFDINAVLTAHEIDEVRAAANMAVYENRAVTAFFPTAEELSEIEYRSKLDLTENVRIVNIDGYDLCACCAPHVSRTGEIGMISVLNFEKHRGGTRIYMLAGRRAERDCAERISTVRRISALTSEPQRAVAAAVEVLINELDGMKQKLKCARMREIKLLADRVERTDGNAVVLLDGFSPAELIAFSNEALPKVGGVLVALSGEDGNFKYVASSESKDLKREVKEFNSALCGRGGGSGMIQGSFASTLYEIKKYFKT